MIAPHVWATACDRCDKIEMISAENDDDALRELRRRGWMLAGGRPICPKHVRSFALRISGPTS